MTSPSEKDAAITLISYHLCPYVQRAVIALTEKGVPFERIDIDLANKPAWFLTISPLGKTPVLKIGETAIFESSVILEYLEETQPNRLHPADPLLRAMHRSWIAFGSAVLDDIAGFYNARDVATADAKAQTLRNRFAQLEEHLGEGPYFASDPFSLVDVVWAPVFRYFDSFDRIADFGILTDKPKTQRWRRILAERPSVIGAVAPDYPARLRQFLIDRPSWLSRQIVPAAPVFA